jgi:transposase InsO family protein
MPGSPLSAPRETRFRWYLQVEKYNKTIPEVCSIFGISKKTYHKWYNRDHGYGSNNHRPRKTHPNLKLTPKVKCAIYEAKTKYNYGPKKMKLYVKDKLNVNVSATVIYRYFKKKHLIRKPRKKQSWYAPMKEPFFSRKPGENVQIDVKYVPSGKEPGTWNYQYRFIDTFTNLQFAVDCYSKSAMATLFAWGQAKKYFPFEIAGVQTDNGGEFRGLFAHHLEKKKIVHRFIPKRSAPWNGKVERANRSVDDEYYLNPTKPFKNLKEYVRWYNYERYHLGRGMDGLTPYQKYQQYMSSALPKRVTLEC